MRRTISSMRCKARARHMICSLAMVFAMAFPVASFAGTQEFAGAPAQLSAIIIEPFAQDLQALRDFASMLFKWGTHPASREEAAISTAVSFDFQLTAEGNQSIQRGGTASNIVVANLLQGTGTPAAFSASGLPAGSTYALLPLSCTLSCYTQVNIKTGSTTGIGDYPITVTATARGIQRSTSFMLSVTAAAPASTAAAGYIKIRELYTKLPLI